MKKEDFEVMIDDFMSDHTEYTECADPLVLGDVYYNDLLGWICPAEDAKATYVLHDDGFGNIVIDYDGTK